MMDIRFSLYSSLCHVIWLENSVHLIIDMSIGEKDTLLSGNYTIISYMS